MLAAAGLGVVAVLAVLVARPETLRFYLKWAFAWMPAGALLAALLLAWLPIRLRARPWSRAGQVQLLLALLAVGFSYSAYARFAPYPNPSFQQGTAYAMPVLAILLAWLHVRVVPRLLPLGAASVRLVGTAWVALLAVCCLGLLVHDARAGDRRRPRAARDDPHDGGRRLGLPAGGGRRPAQDPPVRADPARAADDVALRPDRAPGRPGRSSRCCPGRSTTPADERAAIRTLDDRGVRLAITDGPRWRATAAAPSASATTG